MVDKAFKTLQFSSDAIESIWKMVAIILHLGNLEFSTDESDNASLKGNELAIQRIAKMLNVGENDLSDALTTRVIAAAGQVMKRPHSLKEAETSRESFAKALYDRLFTWVVGHVNAAIDPALTESQTHHNCTVIGVLDIYGFEVFDQNSFEQFCINYCNEKLQQLFIELVLKQQQDEYKREGIEWVHVDYFNNQIICELIDKPHQGVMALMDEACLNVGKTTDKTLLEAMDDRLRNNGHYSSRAIANKTVGSKANGKTNGVNGNGGGNTTNNNNNNHITTDVKSLELHRDFLIRHYAGDVVYNINGFIDKNRDTLFQDFKRLLYNSSNEIYKSMWPEGAHDITATTKRPLTATTIFKNSMNTLMTILASKEPFYVRCVKPNEIKSPNSINNQRVIHQISYLGLMENVRVRRAGFAFRQDYR